MPDPADPIDLRPPPTDGPHYFIDDEEHIVEVYGGNRVMWLGIDWDSALEDVEGEFIPIPPAAELKKLRGRAEAAERERDAERALADRLARILGKILADQEGHDYGICDMYQHESSAALAAHDKARRE